MTEIANLPATLTATDLFFNPVAFEQLQRAATMFASSSLVPAHMQGRDKIGDCAIALALAHEMRESPIMVMQNIYVVKGKAGWNAQYLIARANKYGIFKGNLGWRFEDRGEIEITRVIKDKPTVKLKARNLSATCFATLKSTGLEVSETVDLAMAEAEEWTRNSKYHTMARLMLQYRSATFLIRLNCPEVMMGLPVIEEVEDMVDLGELRAGADGVHRVDPNAPVRPTARRRASATTQAVDVESTITGGDDDTAPGGDDTQTGAGDVVLDTLNQTGTGSAPEKTDDATTGTAETEDGKLTEADTGDRHTSTETKETTTEIKIEEKAVPKIPEVKVFMVPDSRAADWARFRTEFITALNSVNPDQVHEMVLSHAPKLERMKKEDRIGHVALMEKVVQRSEAVTTD